MKRLSMAAMTFAAMFNYLSTNAQEFKISESGCLNNYGVDVAVFEDYYPEGTKEVFVS